MGMFLLETADYPPSDKYSDGFLKNFFRDANTGAGQGITDLAAAVQLRLRVAFVLYIRTHFPPAPMSAD
jgi:hypothetical protein